MEMTQFSVGNALYKGSNIGEKVKNSEGSNTKINDNKYFNDEFSKELKNYSKSNEKCKAETKSVASKKHKMNSNKADQNEESNKTSEDIQSLINYIIDILNKKNNADNQLSSSDFISGAEAEGKIQSLLELLGSQENTNNLLELLNEVSSNSDAKNKFIELLTLINEDFTELKDNKEVLMKLLTSEKGIESDDIIRQLQEIVLMNDDNNGDDSLNIPTRVLMEAEVTDKSSVIAATTDEKESNSKDSKFSNETAILNKVLNGDENDSKVRRATDFMSFFDNSVLEGGEISGEKPVAITKSNLNNDIIKALSYMDKNGVKDLTVKIYPKELGEVSISVSMEQGALKAMIKTTSKEAAEILSLGLKDINEKLSGNNIKIESVDIGLYEEDTTHFARENRQGKAYEDGGKNGNEDSHKISGVSIGEEDGISESSSTGHNEIDLLV
ncbi:flagellar hook-length control protein FliK [Clostridium sp. UBA1056]|uniref:flagellar hook-length control protein FliK n=1 Tax=unclassified Clostridium TaxID=2614128 RepID=UPI0032162860